MELAVGRLAEACLERPALHPSTNRAWRAAMRATGPDAEPPWVDRALVRLWLQGHRVWQGLQEGRLPDVCTCDWYDHCIPCGV